MSRTQLSALLSAKRMEFNTALEPTAAPLVHSTVAVARTRAARSTVPVDRCGSAWVRSLRKARTT